MSRWASLVDILPRKRKEWVRPLFCGTYRSGLLVPKRYTIVALAIRPLGTFHRVSRLLARLDLLDRREIIFMKALLLEETDDESNQSVMDAQDLG